MRIEIWAPDHQDVQVRHGGSRTPTSSDPDHAGWHLGPELQHGEDYFIEVDGLVRPDPLARWLPHGVHGPSRAFDVIKWSWTDDSWQGLTLDSQSVIYELHVGTFTPGGTLTSATEKLSHLVELGVTHIELMPLAAFDGDRGWGYDGVSLNAVHEAYGGPEALQVFVDSAHSAGLAVLLDVVHNHLGPSGNYWPDFGPFFTEGHLTPWGPAVNLDGPSSDDVRAILIDSATSWLRDFHLDGLRLDAVHALRDDRAQHFLEELSESVEQLSLQLARPLALIAESDRNDPRTVLPTAAGGFGMSAQWTDDIHHALHWILTGETEGYYADFGSCESAAKALSRGFLHDGSWSSFRQRSHGKPIDFARTPPSRFVASLQTHDQVGNRATGDRLSALVQRDHLAAGALLLLALPYTPMLFMGEEWGASTPWQYFTAFDDELGEKVTAGRRAEFSRHGWVAEEVPDPQSLATFNDSLLSWLDLDRPDSQRLLTWYVDLIRWHRDELPAELSATCHWSSDNGGRPVWWAIERGDHLAIANLSGETVDIPIGVPQDSMSIRASWRNACTVGGNDNGSLLSLMAGECLALRNTPVPGVVSPAASWFLQ